MKQLFSALLFAVLLIATVGCKPKTNNTANEVLPEDTVLKGGHNSFNSLDIEGVYKAVLPCADCEGIETEITLNQEMTFLKQTKYLGKDEKFYDEKGTYTWNSSGNIITLSEIKGGPNQYFVGENSLTQLDMTGKKITGALEQNYVLQKQPTQNQSTNNK